jgi:hypothetical protein
MSATTLWGVLYSQHKLSDGSLREVEPANPVNTWNQAIVHIHVYFLGVQGLFLTPAYFFDWWTLWSVASIIIWI